MAVASCSARLASSDAGTLGELPAPLLQVRQQLLRCRAPRRSRSLAWITGSTPVRSRRQQGGFEEVEGLQLGLAAVGGQALLALAQLDPAGGDRDQLLVQPGGPGAVEAEPAHQDHAGDGVVGLGQAGPGEVVVDEALGGEPAEQPLDDAVLQVEVDDVLVHGAGVVEDDRPDRRLPPPFPGLLVALARGAGACPSCRPRSGRPPGAGRGRGTGSGRWACPSRRRSGAASGGRRASSAGRRRWRSGNGPRAGRASPASVLRRFWSRWIWAFRSSWRSRAASSSSSTTCRLSSVRVGASRVPSRARRCRGGGCPA